MTTVAVLVSLTVLRLPQRKLLQYFSARRRTASISLEAEADVGALVSALHGLPGVVVKSLSVCSVDSTPQRLRPFPQHHPGVDQAPQVLGRALVEGRRLHRHRAAGGPADHLQARPAGGAGLVLVVDHHAVGAGRLALFLVAGLGPGPHRRLHALGMRRPARHQGVHRVVAGGPGNTTSPSPKQTSVSG